MIYLKGKQYVCNKVFNSLHSEKMSSLNGKGMQFIQKGSILK